MNKKSGLVFGIVLFVLMFSVFSFGIVSANSSAGLNFVTCVDYEVPAKPDPEIKGYIYVEFEVEGKPSSQNVYDECKDAGTVTEYYCKDPLFGSLKPAKVEISCSEGQVCEVGAGACVGGDGVNLNNQKSGSSGNPDLPNYGTGSSSGLLQDLINNGFFGPNNIYTYYECTDTENPSEPNPTEKGSIYVRYSESEGAIQTITAEDSCGPTTTLSSKKTISEFWCKNTDSTFQPVLSVMPCEIGKSCADGACIGGLECNETDGGKNYPVYGEVSGYDPFLHRYVEHDDVCLTDDEIYESYCSTISGEALREYVICSNGCDRSVCIEPAETDDCSDEDGGIDASVTGTVTGLRSIRNSQNYEFTDMCTTEVVMGETINKVVEGYCSINGEVNKVEVTCPEGCTDGSCDSVSGASGCVDSDDGKNYDEIGTVEGTHYGVDGWSLTDSCRRTYNQQNSYLREGYCDDNGEAQYVNVLCEGDCLGATCVVGDEGMGGGDTGVGPDGGDEGGDGIVTNKIKTRSLLSYRFANFVKKVFSNQNKAQTSNNGDGAQTGQKGDGNSLANQKGDSNPQGMNNEEALDAA